MEILISPKRKISEIQEDFQKRFPFLKIEFFRIKSANTGGYTASDILASTNRIGEVAKHQTDFSIRINGLMKVSEIENLVEKDTGLHFEIFRKSGKVWLKTSATDNWTLDEQNKEARESQGFTVEKPEESDYHEQE